ncbi:MAG: SusD/RagB family nutrient-binding outer membrane lipoprotein [Balneolaceae bacterium]|nr:SusD/RagB family nutrient-binding outer membrane lipoprotein [Balneolaceae bacterium]
MMTVLALFMIQCEVISDDHLQDPNNPSPDNVSPDFLLNNIQLELAGKNDTDQSMFQNMSEKGMDVTRMTQMFGTTYESAYSPQLFDDEWEEAYSDIFIDIETLIPLANERELYTHTAIARVIRAYTLLAIADYWGDAPYSEALDVDNFNPAADTDQQLYTTALAQLDSAEADLGKDQLALPGNDLFYGEFSDDVDAYENKWMKVINTLRLKAYVQQRKVNDFSSEINNLVSNPDMLITDAEDAFAFPHSTNSTNPDSRHPFFIANYLGTTDADDYMSNYFMDLLLNDKTAPDPRTRYYVYRQVTSNTTDVNEKQCIPNVGNPPSHYRPFDPFCELTDGYWGRDHGVSLGIPPDDQKKTTFGVYPVGGAYDADQGAVVSPGAGLQGAGIQPLWMPAYTHFLIAEAGLALGTNTPAGSVADQLEAGIRSSMTYVRDFGAPALPSGASGMTPSQIDGYVNQVLDRYNNQAANDTERMALIAQEFYLALWGNGLETYNLFRRAMNANLAFDGYTESDRWKHFPRSAQVHRQPPSAVGLFYSTMKYPSAYTQRNSSAQQKPNNHVQVFWDNTDPTIFDF